MCEPITALLVGTAASTAAGTAATAGLIGAGGAVSSGFLAASTAISAAGTVYAQQQAANAQSASNQRQYASTMQAYRENVNQTNLMQQQEREGSLMRVADNNMKARAAQSTATVAAGENGISGLSVDALMGDLSFDQNRYNSSVQTNFDRAEGAIRNQRENVYANAASQINGLQTPAAPDYLGAGLKIAQAQYDYKQRTK